MNDKFNFFIPADIEKASQEGGKKGNMRIKGIASTPDRDADDEVLDPSGFELGFFLKSGFLNWHHRVKEDPGAIVGEPTMAEVRDDGLYIEGELYEDSDLAKSIYELAETLKKRDSSRRLGFSIEGKVLERDMVDKRNIKRALITGCAITPTPKNPNSIMDVMKGKDTSEPMEYDVQEDPNGGGEIILEVTRGDGTRMTVDRDLKISISKTMTTESGGALVPERVEGSVKEQESFSDTKENSKLVTKSRTFGKILEHVDGIEKAKKVYEHIKQNSTDMSGTAKTQEPTQEDIQKALKDLGIESPKEEEVEDISKSEDPEGQEELEKGEDAISSKEEHESLQEEIRKAEEDLELKKSRLASSEFSEDTEEAGDEEELEKGEKGDGDAEEEEIEKSEDPDAPKSGKGNSDALETISKALQGLPELREDVDELKKSIGDSGELGKKIDDISKGLEKLDDIDERLGKIEEQPQGRKSIQTKSYLEKAFDGGTPNGARELSISADRGEIMGILKGKAGVDKGPDEINEKYANALMQFEASGEISKGVAQDLRQSENVVLTQ